MEKTIIVTGKTVDLAIEAALEQLGLDRGTVRKYYDEIRAELAQA